MNIQKVGAHLFGTDASKNGAQCSQVLHLDGGGRGDDKEQMHRHSVAAAIFEALSADAQGNMHFIQPEYLSVCYCNPMADPGGLQSLTTEHPALEPLEVREREKY